MFANLRRIGSTSNPPSNETVVRNGITHKVLFNNYNENFLKRNFSR